MKKLRNFFKKLSVSWYFLGFSILLCIAVLFVDVSLFTKMIGYFGKILLDIIPTFILMFFLVVISDYYLSAEFIKKYLGSKVSVWIFAILGGIISGGPIYMWYPLLADLRKKFLNYGTIACFLYNRGIKLPLLPVMLLYFDGRFILILGLVMVFVSIVQGLLINIFLRRENEIRYSG